MLAPVLRGHFCCSSEVSVFPRKPEKNSGASEMLLANCAEVKISYRYSRIVTRSAQFVPLPVRQISPTEKWWVLRIGREWPFAHKLKLHFFKRVSLDSHARIAEENPRAPHIGV